MNGIYCLLIRLKKNSIVDVGSLGSIFFKKGNYIYVGSAMSGLEGRINRHLRKEKKMHWHIDYLLSWRDAEITKVFVKETSDKKEECRTAGKIAAAGIPVKNFGCGDCRCQTHLFKLRDANSIESCFKGFKIFSSNSIA